MNRFFKLIKRHNSGQTAIEYIILLAAMMTIMLPLLGYIQRQLKPERSPCPPEDKSIGCGIQTFVQSMGSDIRFRYFTLRR